VLFAGAQGPACSVGWLAFAGFSTSSRWQVQIAVVVLELASVLCLRACWVVVSSLAVFFAIFVLALVCTKGWWHLHCGVALCVLTACTTE